MQFKSFLVPSKGRSNYFQGSITNIGGGSVIIPGGGGGGGSIISQTDFIYCARRIAGTEELTPDQKSHNKAVYDKLASLKGLPGSTPIFYIYGTGNLNPVKYDWIEDSVKTKATPPDWEKPEPHPDNNEKGNIIRFTFIDTEEDTTGTGTASLFIGKIHPSGQVYITSKTAIGSYTPPDPPTPVVPVQKQYILKTKRETSSTTNDTTIYSIIENIDREIADNPEYRMCLLQWKRHQKEGMKWTIPMFCGEWDIDTGEWNAKHPNGAGKTTKYEWADTWWPIHYEINAQSGISDSGVRWFSNVYSSKHLLSSMVDLTIDPTLHCFHNRNKKMRFGVAIFKKTGNGRKGWTRVSNISEILCFAPNGIGAQPHIEVK